MVRDLAIATSGEWLKRASNEKKRTNKPAASRDRFRRRDYLRSGIWEDLRLLVREPDARALKFWLSERTSADPSGTPVANSVPTSVRSASNFSLPAERLVVGRRT
jgi:hypothetical protein